MRLTRVYVDAALEPGAPVSLTGSAANHVTRVLRLRVGAELTLFNGQGGEYAARIAAAKGGAVTVLVAEHRAIERESPLVLTLAQGVSRGERMDLVVQKATELGVSRLVPVVTERSVVRLTDRQANQKLSHWRAIAIGACEQCGRNRLPEIATPVALADYVKQGNGATRLLLSPVSATCLTHAPRPGGAITVLVGPEGGLTEHEQAAAVAGGFTPVRLGPRVLRTETAAIVTVALLQSECGDLGG
jgi:16S rRNA (uracil1498-N3)-methyltransferase